MIIHAPKFSSVDENLQTYVFDPLDIAREETLAMTGIPLEEFYTQVMLSNQDVMKVLDTDRKAVLAVYGCEEISKGVGRPWIWFSKEVSHHKYRLLKDARSVINKWANEYTSLVAYALNENIQSQRFLSALSFKPSRELPGKRGFTAFHFQSI